MDRYKRRFNANLVFFFQVTPGANLPAPCHLKHKILIKNKKKHRNHKKDGSGVGGSNMGAGIGVAIGVGVGMGESQFHVELSHVRFGSGC